MNNVKGYISKKKEGTSLYEELHLEALEIIQKLSSEVWTDFNEHDPGVTILESIVYTITELAHKTLSPIQDILIKSRGQELHSGDNGFFVASDILTTGPITFYDYRKIWIDQISNVKNVWIYPIEDCPGEVDNIKGLLRVFIGKFKYKSDPQEESDDNKRIIQEILTTYNTNRNLCEDIYNIEIYKPLRLAMGLNIKLSNSVNGEEILAKVFNQVNDYMVSNVNYYSLWELQRKDTPINKIFNGPNLLDGFILDEDLKDPLEEIVISDVMKIITQIPGIVSVNDFYFQYKDPDTGDMIQIRDRFKVPKNTRVIATFPKSDKEIVFENSNTFFQPDLNETKKQFSLIRALSYGGFKEASSSLNKISIPPGNHLDMTSYFPIRKQLPELYGIGDRGISGQATDLRKAQVKQLQAYLMPFDQLMVNFLTQLSNIHTLYDVNDNNHASYFTKELPDTEELIDLIKPVNGEYELTKWKETLNDINNRFDNKALKRLSEVANHLLSRFNETFQTYALRKINSSSYGEVLMNEEFDKKLLTSKRQLVREYASISYGRARSFNYHQPEEGEKNQFIPGILRKLAILMDIDDFKIKSLIKGFEDSEIEIHPVTLNIEVVIDAINISQEDLEIIKIEDVTIDEVIKDDLYKVMHYMGDKETLLQDTLKYGVIADNYEIKKSEKEDLYYIFYKKANQEANIVHLSKTQEEAVTAIQKAVAYLVNINQKSEGFFMIEHLLLLPPYKEAYFGFQIDFSLLPSIGLNLKLTHKVWAPCQERNETITTFVNQLLLGQLQYSVIHKKDNYSLEISSSGEDGQEGEVLMVSENQYTSEEALNKDIELLKGLNTVVDEEQLGTIIKCYVNYAAGKAPIDESFFSFQASFIAPSWPVRFQNENFKTMFKNTVYEQFPIHIKYGIYWLDYEDLKTFETSYFKWLEQLSSKSEEDTQKDLAYELITILQKLIEQQDET
ncbi:hypothetical protein Q4Q35_04030 [Flavivirga aquimarina]|uniref:Uncharacterized protein n=1 Tax=Flavivirga aquimarina TaxID=2027862 RepID=A0ABT8W7D0_9FLAO|nr:hypothetical protein [Flavivirga aquimarina]MDO5968967.1 hypothetical protein [Flavivirga aquimarina]